MSSVAPYDDAKALIVAAALGCPVQWPNETWTNPNPPALWVSMEVVGDTLTPIEIGENASYEERGRVFAHVYVPQGMSTRNARIMAKTIANVFRSAALQARPVQYLDASIGMGLAPDVMGNWWTLTLSVEYKYQDFAS